MMMMMITANYSVNWNSELHS